MTVKTPYSDRTAVVTPLTDLLKSRRFLAALGAVIVNILIALIPSLAPVRDSLIIMVTFLVLVLIGSYTASDAAAAGQANTTAPTDTKQTIKEAINEALIELLPDTLEQPAIQISDELIDRLALAVAAKLPPTIINAPTIETPAPPDDSPVPSTQPPAL